MSWMIWMTDMDDKMDVMDDKLDDMDDKRMTFG